jgi:thiosulfate/3-mercaptopyruvate sulfurtransferase
MTAETPFVPRREGIIDADGLRAVAAHTAVNLIEIRSTQPGTDSAGTTAAGATPVFWKDLLWHPDVRDFIGAAGLAPRFRQYGLDVNRPTVVYGDHRQYGFYARWVLRYAGLRPVFVLQRPEQVKRPLEIPSSTAQSKSAIAIEAGPAPRRILRQELLEALRDGGTQIVDARSREEFDGWRVSPPGSPDHGAERAGHIPGARNLHYKDLLGPDDVLKPLAELRRVVEAAGLRPDRPVITYCRLSHRASLLTFVLQELLSFDDVRLYDGSWTEWGSTVGSPIAHNRLAAHTVITPAGSLSLAR